MWLVLHLSGCWLKALTAHTYKESMCTPCSHLRVTGSEQGHSWAEPFPPRESSGNQAVWAGAHPAKCAAARQAQSRTGSTRGGRGLFTFLEATGRQAQQGLLNDVMLPFSVSPLVGLWYVKLYPCRAPALLLGAQQVPHWEKQAWPLPIAQAVTLTAFLWTGWDWGAGLEKTWLCRITQH